MSAVRRMLAANGFLRFPVVLLYCLVGLVVGVAVTSDPALAARVPAEKPDYMMPIYIVERLPNGLVGLLLVAILSAAMSSVSSAMNSLAAVTLEDMRALGYRPKSEGGETSMARILSLAWGVVMIVLSFFAGSIAPTVIEAINKVGSALYGPILGVFAIAILSRRRSPVAANAGLFAGLAVNLFLWKFAPNVFWIWWNFIGLAVTAAVYLSISAILALRPSGDETSLIAVEDSISAHRGGARLLIFYFFAILVVSMSFEFAASSSSLRNAGSTPTYESRAQIILVNGDD